MYQRGIAQECYSVDKLPGEGSESDKIFIENNGRRPVRGLVEEIGFKRGEVGHYQHSNTAVVDDVPPRYIYERLPAFASARARFRSPPVWFSSLTHVCVSHHFLRKENNLRHDNDTQ